MFYIFFL